MVYPRLVFFVIQQDTPFLLLESYTTNKHSSVELGYTQLCVILDNNPTHKLKMQSQLAVHLEQMGLAQSIQVELMYLPSYSPKLNLVEYVIHLLRLRFLHHLPIGTTLAQIEQQLHQFLDSHQFLSAEQVQKTLNYIFSLVP
jgi:transposase